MGIIVSKCIRDAQQISPRERLHRLAAVTADRRTEALQFLAGYDPGTFDAILDAVELGGEDGDLGAAENSVPFCVECGEEIGIFLRYGLGWQHYRDHGDDMTYGRFEVFDAGHAPVLAWRPADVPVSVPGVG
jgi:hypothetical protein